MTPLVALTGATGFIGRNVARSLGEAGVSVRALARRPPREDPTLPPLEWVRGELADSSALRRLVQDTEAVVHCAGTVRGASAAFFDEVNARGTVRLVDEAARRNPPPRFLLLSSLAAREPGLSWYAASKRDAENALRARSGQMPWTVFRPTAVYGRGDREMRRLFAVMRRGVLPVLGPPSARVTLLHVDDLAVAVTRWVLHRAPVAGTFELHDGTPDGYDWRQVARIAEQSWGRRVRCLSVPAALLGGLADLNLVLARLGGYAPMLTPGKVNELRHPDWTCDNAPLTEALGWEPRIDLAKGLGDPGEETDDGELR